MGELTHIDADGRARMVDVSDKAVTTREARAWESTLARVDWVARMNRVR